MVLLLSFSSCHKDCQEKENTSISDCVTTKIEVAVDKGNDFQVDQYRFQGEIVYVFPANASVSEVLKEDCESLGWLGGFTNNQTINGENFSKATFIATVWPE